MSILQFLPFLVASLRIIWHFAHALVSMAAALAEMEIDGTNQDLDDDIEFFNEKGIVPHLTHL